MKKEINVAVTKYEKVQLDNNDIKNISIEVLCEMYNWKPDYYISEDGKKVLEDVEYHTSHSFDITEERRKATKQDKITEKIFKDLNKYFKKLK